MEVPRLVSGSAWPLGLGVAAGSRACRARQGRSFAVLLITFVAVATGVIAALCHGLGRLRDARRAVRRRLLLPRLARGRRARGALASRRSPSSRRSATWSWPSPRSSAPACGAARPPATPASASSRRTSPLVPAAGKKVILVVIDGLTPACSSAASRSGARPRSRELVEAGSLRRAASRPSRRSRRSA